MSKDYGKYSKPNKPQFEKQLDVAPEVSVVAEPEIVKEPVFATVALPNGGSLAIRNLDANRFGVIPDGSKVEVIKSDATTFNINGTNTLMANIKYNDIEGYCVQKYLKF